MKNAQVEITHETNKIYLQFTDNEFHKTGYIDYTDDLWQIVSNSKWRTDGKYIYSGKNTLHKIAMQYWYGKDCYKKMIDSGFVVDHIDNDGFNCLYENLEFLNRIKNWKYKGGYYDIERKNKLPIAAVNIFKKRSGDKFQITIGFNIHFFDSQGLPISKVFFGYDTSDYNLILSDAVSLVESVGNGRINIQHLRFNRKKVEHPYFITSEKNHLKPGNVLKIDGEWVIIQGDGFQVVKVAPDDTLW
jgi:hypothetical protein